MVIAGGGGVDLPGPLCYDDIYNHKADLNEISFYIIIQAGLVIVKLNIKDV